ncbi:MAG: DUF1553 domain-containing protein [Bacteroidota bacterium]
MKASLPTTTSLRWLSIILIPTLFWACGPSLPREVAEAYDELPEKIDFNYHVRPILSDRCWSCHGPDEKSRRGGLRLDIEEEAFASLASGNGKAIVKGNLGRSQTYHRMVTSDTDLKMPPPESNLTLTPKEIAVISKWIEQGAEWKPHWAFIPPSKPTVPTNLPPDWNRKNEIDAFIQKKLQTETLQPSPEADRALLLRRVKLDLIGLPPTQEELDAFLQDQNDDAYEKMVDKFLSSSSYGERMAMEWLDLARYADSHGLHADGARTMWPWRDWVIRALDMNMPYDQFISEQLAGDLLPKPTQDQILATAFNRNNPMTAEGGVVDEEFRLEYVFDRTNTVSTAILGLTMECARCHDHKFDPISQKEYYQFASFFNNLHEIGMTGDDGDYGPMLTILDDKSKVRLQQLDNQIKKRTEILKAMEENMDDIKSYVNTLPPTPAKRAKLDQIRYQLASNGKTTTIIDGNKKYTSRGKLYKAKGKVGSAVELKGEYDDFFLNNWPTLEAYDQATIMMWMNTQKRDSGKTQTLIGTTGEKNNFWRGWEMYLDDENYLNVRLVHSLPHNYIHCKTKDSLPINEWLHVGFSYDGSMKAEGLTLFLNGEKAPSNIKFDRLTKSIHPVNSFGHKPVKKAWRAGISGRAYTQEWGIFQGLMDDIRFYKQEMSATELAWAAGMKQLNKKDETQLEGLQFASLKSSKSYRKEIQKRAQLLKARMMLMDSLEEIMVMEETPGLRQMHVLNRGQYDQPEEKVEPGTPQSVLDFGEEYESNRQGLVKWLFDDHNPLTARVAVNRYWQLFFGQGLVKTPHDFGNQGALPTHPELLDWLAIRFRESGWDVKAMHKMIVMSATYKQSSRQTPELQERDPNNSWIARGPSYRLPAEIIRDNALSASGLLNPKKGGKSVKPYQPDGLWKEKSTFSFKLFEYKPDSGESLYRRSLYTFIRRTSPPPFMDIFDAPNRDRCVVQREITNTPLQALVLLNDPQFLEAARVLAQKVQHLKKDHVEEQIRYAFRQITCESPSTEEIAIFKKLYEEEWKRFKSKPKQAKEYLSVGEYPLDPELDLSKTAALATVTHTMMNQDLAYMKR